MYEIQLIRVLNDLKYGIPVILKNGVEILNVVPIDRINENQYLQIKQNWPNAQLVISGQRAKFLSNNSITDNSQLPCKNLTWQQVHEIIYADSIKQYKWQTSSNITEHAMQLLQLAEIFPAFIAATPNVQKDHTITFNVTDLAENIATINNNIYEVCQADLKLKKGKGKIIAFRCHWQKDHYAIIIEPVDTASSSPLVRLHSSCFTGDLLASLKCDCYDQLQGAIEIMSANNGGVILYINQEGRGIGLTNKVRVYNMIAKGYDTVEANENLGFDNDLRDFSIAANILQMLDINEIKLLSNNPNKGKVLQKHGIKIKEHVSHQFLHEEIKKYYHAKAHKMDHNIDIK